MGGEEQTQGNLLREYMAEVQPTSTELSARSEGLQRIKKIFADELAARMGLDVAEVKAWLKDEKPAMYDGAEKQHIKPLKDALGLDGEQAYFLNQARKKLADKVFASAETSTQKVVELEQPKAEIKTEGLDASSINELKAEAGAALRALLMATPKSDKETKKRQETIRSAGVDSVLPVELARRKGVKLKMGEIKMRMGDPRHSPRARTTPAEAEMLIKALSQSIDKGDAEFKEAADHFRDSVDASQAAWDASDQQHADQEASRIARRAERGQER